MRRTQAAIDAFIAWKEQSEHCSEAFSMGYLMGQGDALQGLDNVIEGVETVDDVQMAITVLMEAIVGEVAESYGNVVGKKQ